MRLILLHLLKLGLKIADMMSPAELAQKDFTLVLSNLSGKTGRGILTYIIHNVINIISLLPLYLTYVYLILCEVVT